MNPYEQFDDGQVLCPKCGQLTPDGEMCQNCGALLSRLFDRATGKLEQTQKSPGRRVASITDAEDFDERSVRWPTVLTAAVALAVLSVTVWYFIFGPGSNNAIVQPVPSKKPVLARQPKAVETMVKPIPAAGIVQNTTESASIPDPAKVNAFVSQVAGSLSRLTAPTPSPTPNLPVNGFLSKVAGSLNKLAEPAATESPRAATEVNSEDAPAERPVTKKVALATPVEASNTESSSAIVLDEDTFMGAGLKRVPNATVMARAANPQQNSLKMDGLSAPDAAGDKAPTIPEVNNANFSSQVFQPGGAPVLVYFFSAGSSSYSGAMESIAADFSGRMKVVKVDGQANSGLAASCRVQTFPTIVLFKRGRESMRFTGSIDTQEIREQLSKAL
jgi:thioredoxin 1